jgi:uncharacterized protein YecE (DUF72 family)
VSTSRRRSHVRIGISGWRYAGWRGEFYPKTLKQADELAHASRAVQTIEINGSHYSLQSPESFQAWHDATPAGFLFAVKGPRFLTHMLRFRGERTEVALANFFASGVFCLGPKLGPILWQFPPTYRFDPEAFEAVLRWLPADTDAAAALARKHDAKVKHPMVDAGRKRRLRHAIEIRHDSFRDPAFVALLRRHRAALVVSDAVADWPYAEDLSADFVYIRLHGTETLYGGSYTDEALDRWADRIATWADGREPADAVRISPTSARKRASREVFCYFDNDKKVRAPFDAARLMDRLGVAADK